MSLKSVWLCSLSCLIALGCSRQAPTASQQLVTGKSIGLSPIAIQPVGNLPMNMILTPDGRYALTSDMGYREFVWAIDTATGRGISNLEFSNKIARSSAPGGEVPTTLTSSQRSNGLYYGLAASSDGLIYAAQGSHDAIAVLSISPSGQLTRQAEILTKPYDCPAGLALDAAGHLFVANNASGGSNPLAEPGSVSIYDSKSRTEIGRFKFTDSFFGTSNFAYAIAALSNGSKVYVTAERDDAVYVLDTRQPATPTLLTRLSTGARPIGLTLSADQSRLYVANSQGDTVSVIDTQTDKVVGTVLLRPQQVRDLPGCTPIAMAISPDGKSLYVALADMNAIAVVDTNSLDVRGYIPVGWYPTAVALSPDGHRLLVADGKGSAAMLPNATTLPTDSATPKHPYVLDVVEGDVRTLPVPNDDTLKSATAAALAENHFAEISRDNPLANLGIHSGRITHVIYIIKENRTYDQILGDLPQGNGDASLVLFGRQITPNQHALAERFVLLDNLYCSGEVSGDGWNWSTQSRANAYVERNVPYNYSRRGRKFDFEGQNNGYPTAGTPRTDSDGKPAATNPIFANGSEPIPDVASSGNALWDLAAAAHLRYRNYGFYLYFVDDAAGTIGGPDNYPTSPNLRPAGHDLAGVSDLDFRRFDMDYPDSDGAYVYVKRTGKTKAGYATATYGKYQQPSRFSEWNREFQMTLKNDPTGASVPALTMIRLPCDHTVGMKAGKHSPRSQIADNDCGLGEIVDAVSHSAIWEHTAIFVVEDDAQSGADHVDVHRAPAQVISPWIKTASIDHHFYNTDSVLKTMELLLDLPPMSQYDAIASPIMDWDATPANIAPFTAIVPPDDLIAETNPILKELGAKDLRRPLVVRSDLMDFTHADRAPAADLNEIIWKSVRGPASIPPRQRGTVSPTPPDDDD